MELLIIILFVVAGLWGPTLIGMALARIHYELNVHYFEYTAA